MLAFVEDFWRFLRVRKKYWLIPIFTMLAVLGALTAVEQESAVAPSIYTLF